MIYMSQTFLQHFLKEGIDVFGPLGVICPCGNELQGRKQHLLSDSTYNGVDVELAQDTTCSQCGRFWPKGHWIYYWMPEPGTPRPPEFDLPLWERDNWVPEHAREKVAQMEEEIRGLAGYRNIIDRIPVEKT